MAQATRIKKKKTNEQFFHNLLNFARSGPIMVMVLFEALRHYCEIIKNENPEEFDKMMESSMIHGPSWRRACEELGRAVDEHLAL